MIPIRFTLPPGTLAERSERAVARLEACDLCGANCGIDRTQEPGPCRSGRYATVASYFPHHGRLDCLHGWKGAGTILFGGCNLHCSYCQFSDISQAPAGQEVNARELASLMIELQGRGCHNINLVSPGHNVAQVLEALAQAEELRLPIIWNSNGYESAGALKLLDGVVDVYIVAMKFASDEAARQHADIKNYPEINQTAVREMHRQVGDLQLDQSGLATAGLLVRHQVLPAGLAGTHTIARFLADLSDQTAVQLVKELHPFIGATSPLNRRPSTAEIAVARIALTTAGLTRLL